MACPASVIDSSGVAGDLMLASATRIGVTSFPRKENFPPEQPTWVEAILPSGQHGRFGVIIWHRKASPSPPSPPKSTGEPAGALGIACCPGLWFDLARSLRTDTGAVGRRRFVSLPTWIMGMRETPMHQFAQALRQNGLVRFIEHYAALFPTRHLKDLVVDDMGPHRI